MQTSGPSEGKAVNLVSFQEGNRAVLLFTLLLFTQFGFACGTSNTNGKIGAQHRKRETLERCANGKPIGARLLRDALRTHGFTARCQVRRPAIGGAEVANFTPTTQGAEEARADREGPVICEVRKRPVGRMARDPHKVFEYDSLPTHAYPGRQIFLANVDCSLYLVSSPRKEAARQLRAAIDELNRAY